MRFVAPAGPTRRAQSLRAVSPLGLHRSTGLPFAIRLPRLLLWGIALLLGVNSANAAASDDLRSRVDAIVAQHLGQGAVASLAIGIHERGRESTFFYGDAGRDLGAPTADTLFELGSLTQVFTATILAALVERGLVRLEDPLQQFVPRGITVPSFEGRAIRLIDLATHTSGLPPDIPRQGAVLTLERMWEFVNAYKLGRAPGSQYLYSNLGFALLGRALVRAAGTQGYQELLTREVLVPLGMSSTWLLPELPSRERLSVGRGVDGEIARYDLPSWPALLPASGLSSSLDDMMKFLRFATGARETALSSLLEILERPRRRAAPYGEVALGWQVHALEKDRVFLVAKNGGTLGFSSLLAFVPSLHLGVVVLAGSPHQARQIGSEILQAITTEVRLPQEIPDESAADDQH
jgi:CubicO group peptidase (beta-lactamase class C family)